MLLKHRWAPLAPCFIFPMQFSSSAVKFDYAKNRQNVTKQRNNSASLKAFAALDGRAHWRHLANTTERSVRGGDAAVCSDYLVTNRCCWSSCCRPCAWRWWWCTRADWCWGSSRPTWRRSASETPGPPSCTRLTPHANMTTRCNSWKQQLYSWGLNHVSQHAVYGYIEITQTNVVNQNKQKDEKQ